MNYSSNLVSERRKFIDRRIGADRREAILSQNPAFRLPAWRDQQLQYALRLIILVLAIVYFNLLDNYNSHWMSLEQLNSYFFIHGVITLICYWHATQVKISLFRFRFAILVDVIGVSIGTLNDPVNIPPCMIVYILIVLGNGMRYGMRLFRESLIVCFFAAMLVMSARYIATGGEFSLGLAFMNVFGTIILLYSYILMSRLEASRISLENLSQRDALTGLLNRRALYDKVEKLLKINNTHDDVVVIFADLDKFKQINDNHGHAAGDLALKNVAEILKQTTRRADLLSRYGGDEFVIIMPNTSISVAETIALRIQKSVRSWAKSNQFAFDISLGIGEMPRHGTDLDTVLNTVDEALYHAKLNHGPGGCCYAIS